MLVVISNDLRQAARHLFDVGTATTRWPAITAEGHWCLPSDPRARYWSVVGAIDLVTLGDQHRFRAAMDAANHRARNIPPHFIDVAHAAMKTKNLGFMIKLLYDAAEGIDTTLVV